MAQCLKVFFIFNKLNFYLFSMFVFITFYINGFLIKIYTKGFTIGSVALTKSRNCLEYTPAPVPSVYIYICIWQSKATECPTIKVKKSVKKPKYGLTWRPCSWHLYKYCLVIRYIKSVLWTKCLCLLWDMYILASSQPKLHQTWCTWTNRRDPGIFVFLTLHLLIWLQEYWN